MRVLELLVFTEAYTMEGDAIVREGVGPRHILNSAAWGIVSRSELLHGGARWHPPRADTCACAFRSHSGSSNL